MKTTLAFLLVALALTTSAPAAEDGTDLVPFDSDRWEIHAREWRLEEHLGRPSLYLKGGLAWIRDADVVDGKVEFDIAFTGERGFMGAMWRLVDANNQEQFYLRPHQSGNPDANQYTPAFGGLTGWQLYYGPEYSVPVTYPVDTWIHVAVAFSGSQAEVYLDSDEPLLFIPELKRDVVAGQVGVTCANFAGAHFSRFRYQRLERPTLRGTAPPQAATPPGTVTSWRVSSAFDEKSLDGKTVLADADKAALTWDTLAAERTGVANLARLRDLAPEHDTVFARIVVVSDRAQVKKLRFGYSDRVKVYFRDRLVYGGQNDYMSRDYRYLGTIGLFDELYLPLEKGRNEIWLAVSESFGGWGVLARFDDFDGLRLE